MCSGADKLIGANLSAYSVEGDHHGDEKLGNNSTYARRPVFDTRPVFDATSRPPGKSTIEGVPRTTWILQGRAHAGPVATQVAPDQLHAGSRQFWSKVCRQGARPTPIEHIGSEVSSSSD